jgi:hypothetical protein
MVLAQLGVAGSPDQQLLELLLAILRCVYPGC